MPPKRKNRWHSNDVFDEFLRSRRLWRKAVAKDGSCLFRAVSEQVFHCQARHLEVRQACVNFMRRLPDQFQGFIEGPFDHYLAKISNPREWGGQVEMKALSLLYQRDFIVYREAGGEPDNVTSNGFDKKITLCFLGGNHYDSVYPLKFQKQASMCQAVVYRLLYGRVFPQVGLGYNSVQTDQDQSVDLESSDSTKVIMKGKEKKKTSLSFQELSSMVPELQQYLKQDFYVNVELEVWKELRQSKDQTAGQQQSDRTVAVDMQYQIGDMCEARLSAHTPFTTVEILDIKSTKGPLRIRLLETGKELTIQMKYLRPISQLQGWMPQELQCRNLSGYYRKPPDEEGFQEVPSSRRKKQQSENGSKRQSKENKEAFKQTQPKSLYALESLPELEGQVTSATEATGESQLENIPGWQPPVVSMQEQELSHPVMSYAKVASSGVETKPVPVNEEETDDKTRVSSVESNEGEKTPQHLLSDSASNHEIQSETNGSQNLADASVSVDGKNLDESQATTPPLMAGHEFPKRPSPFMQGPWLPFHPHPAPSNFNLKDLVPSQDPDVKDLPTDLPILQYVYNIGFMYLRSYQWHQMYSLNLRQQQQLMAAQMASQLLSDNRVDEQNTKDPSPNEPEAMNETPEASHVVENVPPESEKQSSPMTNTVEDPKLNEQILPTHDQRDDDTSAASKDCLPAATNQLQDKGFPPQLDTNQMLPENHDHYPNQDVGMQNVTMVTATSGPLNVPLQIEMDDDPQESHPTELYQQTTDDRDMTQHKPQPTPQFSSSVPSFHMPPNQSAKAVSISLQQRLMDHTGQQRGWHNRRRRQFRPQVYHQQQPVYYESSSLRMHSQMGEAEQHGVDEEAAYYMPGTGSVVRQRDGRVTLVNSSVPGQMYYVPNTGVQFSAMDTQNQWFPDRS